MTGNQSTKRYPAELKERAVKMTLDLQRGDPGDHGVINRVSRQLGVGSESLRIWVKRAEINAGAQGALTSAQESELKELRKEVRELRRANAILQSASAFFGAELDRRSAK
jgi:transposase